VSELADLFSSLALPQSDDSAIYQEMKRVARGMSPAFQMAPICDLERVLALKMPLSSSGRTALEKKIKAWNSLLPVGGSSYVNNSSYELVDFMLERALAQAPDLPTESALTKLRAQRAKNDGEDADDVEFHHELAKVTTHSWFMDVLGLTFDVTIEDPPVLPNIISI